jgi:hypothetical protein
MLVPRFWAKADGSATSPQGKRYRFALWGWSNESVADALAVARERLAAVSARVGAGTLEANAPYLYGSRPLREEIVREVAAAEEGAQAVVTRNRYGALVLNTDRVPFIDIDQPPAGGLKGLFRRLTGRETDAGQEALARIRSSCAAHPTHSFRIYRTKAGFRVLATDLLLDPAGDESRQLLEGFGADPFFVRLCAVQESFRARLTPKPWRCGCPLPPGAFPREEPNVQAAFAPWLERYEQASQRHATCRYLESVGGDRQLPGIRRIVAEHDRTTRADSDLPLA